MTVIFVDADGNPDPPLADQLADNVALLYLAPTATPLPSGATAHLPADYLDAGIITLPEVTSGRFQLRCLETNRTTLRVHRQAGRHTLVIDAVDGVQRVRRVMADVLLEPVRQKPWTPGGPPVEWVFDATVDPANVTVHTSAPELA